MDTNKKLMNEIAKKIKDSHEYYEFDRFIIEKILGKTFSGFIEEEKRREAFLSFRKKTNRIEFATIPTIRRWFGIGGIARPSRKTVFEICFALHASVEETEEYLLKGMGEPSFQICDYHEMIYMYGIENNNTIESCEGMIASFEEAMAADVSINQKTNTAILQRGYENHKRLTEVEFMLWMRDHISDFKGYSKTALNYLVQYKSKVAEYIRGYAELRLDNLLRETNYYSWLERCRVKNKDRFKMVKSYVNLEQKRMSDKIPDRLLANIQELANICYSRANTNSMVISEVFVSTAQLEQAKRTDQMVHVYNMTPKYISDLLNVAAKKEQEIYIRHALRYLEDQNDKSRCPQWINEIIDSFDNNPKQGLTVKNAKEKMQTWQKEQKRRQIMIQREDILPMILYVAQQKYLELCNENGESYHFKAAKELFVNMANGVLNACSMVTLDKKYRIDALLLNCYQVDDMFSYSDMLEALYGKKDERGIEQ